MTLFPQNFTQLGKNLQDRRSQGPDKYQVCPSHWSFHTILYYILSKLFSTLVLQTLLRDQDKTLIFSQKSLKFEKSRFQGQVGKICNVLPAGSQMSPLYLWRKYFQFSNFFSADRIYQPEVFPNERSWVELFLTRRCGDSGKAYSTIRLIR